MKLRINLLQPELIPSKQLLTLNTVALSWSLALVTVFIIAFYSQQKLSQLNGQYEQIQTAYNSRSQTLEELQQLLGQRKPDKRLQAELEKLKQVIDNKAFLVNQLTASENAQVAGFAQVMTELAQFHHPDISLTRVLVSNEQVTLVGQTRHPESVPNWLSSFEQASFLSGQTFADFSMLAEQDSLTQFKVSSVHNAEESGQ